MTSGGDGAGRAGPAEPGQQIYTQRHYWAATLGPLALLGALLALSIARLAWSTGTTIDRYVIVIVPIVLLVNILGMRQPRRIIDSPESLILEGMGRRHVFRWRELTSLKVKEFAFTDRVYVRIEPSSLLAGSFWVDIHKYPGLGQLMAKFLATERALHPERAPFQRTAPIRTPGRRT